MALNQVIINRNSTGLNRELPSQDNISAMIFYTDNLPSGYSDGDRVKKVRSIGEVEALGIINTHTDETKATGGAVTIDASGSTGTWAVKIDGGTLGSYDETAGDFTDTIASGLVTAINTLTNQHGYASTLVASGMTLTAPGKLGISINDGSHLTTTNSSSSGSSTVTQFNGGTASEKAYWHYHASEFFRIQPEGILYLSLYKLSAQTTYAGTEIQTVQNQVDGKIRQFNVNLSKTYASSQVTASQTYATLIETDDKSAQVLLNADFSGLTLSTLADLKSLDSKNISVLIGQDANFNLDSYSNTKAYLAGEKLNWNGSVYTCVSNSTGNIPDNTTYFKNIGVDLSTVLGYSVGTGGLALGAVSLASVSDSIAWPGKFDLSSSEFVEAGFATGERAINVTKAEQNTLNDNNYIFLRNFSGNEGLYFTDSYTCTLRTSDFVTIENNRTSDKAIRNIRQNLIPQLNAPIFVDSEGHISEGSIQFFSNLAETPLSVMLRSQELSDYTVTIDPDQLVLTTSKISIGVILVPVGVARNIELNISFAVSTVTA